MTEHIEQTQREAFLDDFAKKHHGFEAVSRSLGETLVTRT